MQLDQSHPNHKSCKPMSDKSKTFHSSNTPFTSPPPQIHRWQIQNCSIHKFTGCWKADPEKLVVNSKEKRKHNSFDPSKSFISILWLQGSIQSHPKTLFVLVLKNFWWQILAASNSQILDWQECQPGVRGGDQSPDYENWELFEYLSGRLLWVLFCETFFGAYQGDLFKLVGTILC